MKFKKIKEIIKDNKWHYIGYIKNGKQEKLYIDKTLFSN